MSQNYFNLYSDNKNKIIRDGDVITIKNASENMFCHVPNDNSQIMECNGDIILGQFQITKINKKYDNEPIYGTDVVSLKYRGSSYNKYQNTNNKNNKYCSYDDNNIIKCNKNSVSETETFIINNFFNTKDILLHGDMIKLITVATNRYCAHRNSYVRCSVENNDRDVFARRYGFLSGMVARHGIFRIYKL